MMAAKYCLLLMVVAGMSQAGSPAERHWREFFQGLRTSQRRSHEERYREVLSCPDGFFEESGYCYHFSNEDMVLTSWLQAGSYCQSFGRTAHLYRPQSEECQNKVQDLMIQNNIHSTNETVWAMDYNMLLDDWNWIQTNFEWPEYLTMDNDTGSKCGAMVSDGNGGPLVQEAVECRDNVYRAICQKKLCKGNDDNNGGGGGAHWSYEDKNDWPQLFPEQCGGRRQSPVNLDFSTSEYQDFGALTFGAYNETPSSWDATNNGHSAQLWSEDFATVKPYITGGSLGVIHKYYLEQFHFHWGSNSSQGSEHQFNYTSYPMEVHFVHRSDAHDTLAEAVAHPGGLAVVGVMFQLSGADNPALDPIIEALENITEAESSARLTSAMRLDALLPAEAQYPPNRDELYSYTGGLTTPTCNEVVNWVVMKNPVTVSEAQLDKFRALKDKHGHPIVDNFRDPQPLNGRTVYINF